MTKRDAMALRALQALDTWEVEILAIYEIWQRQIEQAAAAGVFQRRLALPDRSKMGTPWSTPVADTMFFVAGSPQLKLFLTILARLLEQDGYDVRSVNADKGNIVVNWEPRAAGHD